MPTATFTPIQSKSRTRLRDLWSSSVGIKRGLTQVLVLSILIQIFAIVTPLYLQLVIDQAVSRSDKNFLVFLALSFAFVHVINSLTTALRSRVIMLFGQSLSFQMTGNVMRHLARLPFSIFSRKGTFGDIISRIGSVSADTESTDPVGHSGAIRWCNGRDNRRAVDGVFLETRAGGVCIHVRIRPSVASPVPENATAAGRGNRRQRERTDIHHRVHSWQPSHQTLRPRSGTRSRVAESLF